MLKSMGERTQPCGTPIMYIFIRMLRRESSLFTCLNDLVQFYTYVKERIQFVYLPKRSRTVLYVC